MSNLRSRRKKEHLILAVQGSRCSFTNLLDDIMLPHNCLTEINPGQVDLSSSLCGYGTALPIYINAITGGALLVEHVNRELAMLAARHRIPMAVGSQMAGLRTRSLGFTYRVTRKYNPEGLLMANLSATASPRQAQRAVEMIEAQILQLHLNPAQELIMPEGDMIQPGLLENIANICASVPIPVMVKEVGFGIGANEARLLTKAGVKAVDVSGTGGTDFACIEGQRNRTKWWKPFANWGLPTPLAVAEVWAKVPGLEVLASGGVDDGVRALKCLGLGASGVGIAGGLLRQLYKSGREGANQYLTDYIRQIRTGMALMGARTGSELRGKPLLITGRLRELLMQRDITPEQYALRGE